MTKPAKLSLEELEKKLADADARVEAAPNDPQAYAARAVVYKQMEQFREAVADYSTALELKPGDAHMLTERAILYRRLSELKPALADLKWVSRKRRSPTSVNVSRLRPTSRATISTARRLLPN